ncbi:energy-coupling factor ABC transporter ATP-binding protein [Caldanaerobacter sp.]|uniref:energy-coupling factor ABC transporter ATP-binding protein n=1 Tax=Caldanaerobacter sp. TaxID=2930036 RepID=UPI003C7281C9
MNMETILEAVNVSFEYADGAKALQGINMKIEKGKKIAVLGPNGAGKTTLFLHFNGILKPKSGKIMYKGKEILYNRKELIKLRKNVGIVFQNPDVQLFSATVYQEISFGPMNLGYEEKIVRAKVDEIMGKLNISHLKDKPVHFLSYGQKKIVSIADILVMDPEVIILDEPTAYLDVEHTEELIKLLDDLKEEGKTIVVSTHDVDFAFLWADYIYVMKDGKIIKEGTPYEIFTGDSKGERLKKPLILEIYEILKDKNIIHKEEIPRKVEELKKAIRGN